MTRPAPGLRDRTSTPAADEEHTTGDGGVRAGLLRVALVGVVTGVVTAGLVLAVPGPWLVVPLTVALVLLAPTARRADRRLALNLSLLVGWTPVATWVPDVVGDRTPAVAALAVATGAAAAAVAGGRPVRPAVARRDAAIATGGLLGALVALPLLLAGTAPRALAMLSTGLDNGYHFTMYLERRLGAVGSPLVASRADGSGFAFDDYPNWYHRLLTVLADGVFGSPGSATTELVRFGRLQWAVFALVAALATAAVLQALPADAPAPVVVPAVAVVWSLWLGVPGAINLIQGHLSFLLAASAPVVLFLLLVGSGRRLGPAVVTAVAGLVVLAASWQLLLPLAAACAASPVLGLWRQLSRRVRTTLVVAGGLVAVACFLVVLPKLTGNGLAALLTDGTIPRIHPVALAVVVLGAVLGLVLLRRRSGDLDLVPHLVVAVTSLAVLVAVGGYMLVVAGELTYYFWKLALAAALASFTVLVQAVGSVLSARAPWAPSRRPRARLVAAAVTLLAALGLGNVLQEFTAPSAVWAGITPVSLAGRPTNGEAGDVDLVLRLAAATPPQEAARTRLVATRPEDMNAAHALVWFHALSHSATHRAMDENTAVFELADEPEDTDVALGVIGRTLAQPDRRVLVTDPRLYERATAALPADEHSRLVLVD